MTAPHYVPVREIDHFVQGEVVDVPIDPDQQLRVVVVLRPRTPHHTMREHLDHMSRHLPHHRRYLTRDEFVHQYGATDEDLAVVAAFAGAHNLEVAEMSHPRRRLVLSGKAGDLSTAFNVKFVHLHDPEHGVYRSHMAPIHVPAELKPLVHAVMGFSARAHHGHPAVSKPDVSHVHWDLMNPRTVAETYQFPEDCSGRGQTIGIIVLGGGFHREDLDTYFKHLGLPTPKITVVEVDGQGNNPADPEAIRDYLAKAGIPALRRAKGESHSSAEKRRNSAKNIQWTIETTMDVELVGTWANQAHIVVYFTHNNARGKYDAFSAALFDTTHHPDVISCSWGAPERLISRILVEEMDLMFQAAALMGVTIVCSSGDDGNGSSHAGEPQPYFPASSPHVLACGGTTLPHGRGKKAIETVWRETIGGDTGESGYGESSVFQAPSWQSGTAASQRGGRVVPDVAGKADALNGYQLVVGGDRHVPGNGTSAAAPLWASLAALLNEKLKARVGHLNPLLYQELCRQGIQPVGSSATGWAPEVGLGSPRGTELLQALRSKADHAE